MSQDSISLKLEPRKTLGKAVKHLRREGQTPAVIHDHGKPSLHMQGESLAMLKVWQKAGKHHPVELKAGDKSFVALIKDAEFDPRKHQLQHIVFNAVDKDQKVEAEIPIRARYGEGNESSPAERNGLIVLSQLDTIQVKAVPTSLPDFVEYNAEKLVEIGDHVTVADLMIPEGVEVETEAEHSVATVYEPSALAAANEAAAGTAEAEPEAVEEGEEGDTAEGAPEGEGGEAPAEGGAKEPAADTSESSDKKE